MANTLFPFLDQQPHLPVQSPPMPSAPEQQELPLSPAPQVSVQQPTHRQLLRPFWVVGAFLMMLDGLTTYIALTYHSENGAREGNPIAIWAIEHLGVAGMCITKVVIGVAMMWRLAAAADRGHKMTWMNRGLTFRNRPEWKVRRNAAWTLAFSVVLMGVVVGNNLRAIISLWAAT